MKNINKILIFLLLINFSILSFTKERINFIKKGNDFYFFKYSGKTISMKKNNSKFEPTYIDIPTESLQNINFRKINNNFYLYIKINNNKLIYKLNNKRWEKIVCIEQSDIKKGLFPEPYNKIENLNKNNSDFQFGEIKNNIIISGNIRYILPETFDTFYMEKDKIYTLSYQKDTLLIKKFKVKAGLPYPPLNVIRTFEHNYSLYSEEYLNKISWAPNPMNSTILNYYIYKRDTKVSDSNFVFEAKITPKTYFYLDRELKKEDENRFVYGVSVVDITLGESDIVTTTGKTIKPTIGPIKAYCFNNQ